MLFEAEEIRIFNFRNKSKSVGIDGIFVNTFFSVFFFNRNKKYSNRNNARINFRLISDSYFIYF